MIPLLAYGAIRDSYSRPVPARRRPTAAQREAAAVRRRELAIRVVRGHPHAAERSWSPAQGHLSHTLRGRSAQPAVGGGGSRLLFHGRWCIKSLEGELHFSMDGGAGNLNPVVERPQLGE